VRREEEEEGGVQERVGKGGKGEGRREVE